MGGSTSPELKFSSFGTLNFKPYDLSMIVDFNILEIDDYSVEELSQLLKAMQQYDKQGTTDFGLGWVNHAMRKIVAINEKNKERQKAVSESRRKAVNARWARHTNVCKTDTNVSNNNTNECQVDTNVCKSNTIELKTDTNVCPENSDTNELKIHTNVCSNHTNVCVTDTNVSNTPIYNNNIYNNNNSNIISIEESTERGDKNSSADLLPLLPTETEEPHQPPKKKVRQLKQIIPADENEVSLYIQANALLVNPHEFYQYYAVAVPPWTDRDGKPVRNWKQKCITWSNRNKSDPRYQQAQTNAPQQRSSDGKRSVVDIARDLYGIDVSVKPLFQQQSTINPTIDETETAIITAESESESNDLDGDRYGFLSRPFALAKRAQGGR